ncbi:hypothetical protein EOM09_08480 [bacterium]|nr:hypothetical protein [bacterium]
MWFVPLFLIISIISYLFYIILITLIEHKNLSEVKTSSKHIAIILISYIFSSWIFVWIFLKRDLFYVSYELLSGALLGIANISQTYIWPNVQTTIAELNPASFLQIIQTVGGKFFFFFAFFGMVLMLLDFKKKKNISKLSSIAVIFFSLIWFISIIAYNAFSNLLANSSFIFLILLFLPIAFAFLINIFEKNKDPKIFFVIFLSIWMAATIYMSLNGVRFILLLAPGFAIASAIGLYQLAKILNNFISEEFKIKNDFFKTIYGNTFIFLIFLLFFVLVPVDLKTDSNQQSLFGQAELLSQGSLPNFDDAWFLAFEKLNNQSNENAIITSWWDFGHFFIAVGNRGTTFDGGSQTTPASHWV